MGAFCLASLPTHCQPTLPIPHWSNNKQVTILQSTKYDKTLKVNLQSWRAFKLVVIYVHCYFWVGPAPEIDATEQLIQKVAPIMIWLMGICICICICILCICILVISWSRKAPITIWLMVFSRGPSLCELVVIVSLPLSSISSNSEPQFFVELSLFFNPCLWYH